MDPEDKPEDKPDDKPEDKPEDKPTGDPDLQRELEEARAKIKTFEDAETARANAELTEAEREKKRADDLEAQNASDKATLRRLAILSAIGPVAKDLKVDLDESAIEDLYEAKAFDKVKVNDKGKPEGLTDIVKDLVKKKPYIVKRAVEAPDNGARNRGEDKKPDNGLDDARREKLKKRFRLGK